MQSSIAYIDKFKWKNTWSLYSQLCLEQNFYNFSTEHSSHDIKKEIVAVADLEDGGTLLN